MILLSKYFSETEGKKEATIYMITKTEFSVSVKDEFGSLYNTNFTNLEEA